MITANRVASLRDEYARIGEDVSGLSDLDLMARALDRADDETNTLRKRDEDRRSNAVDNERALRTAARRQYEDRMARWGDLAFSSIVASASESVRVALYRAANLLSMPAADDIIEVRDLASRALSRWEGESRLLLDGAGRFESWAVAQQQREEIGRLRKLITAHATAMADHRRESGRPGQICKCGGCELVRSMDDVEETPAAA